MNPIDLPAEIIFNIVDCLTEGEVAQLLLVNKYMHARFSEYLLRRNARRKSLRALLWATSKPERLSVAQRLIQYGADIDRRFDLSLRQDFEKGTLLHFAAFTKRPSMVSTLIKLGADPTLLESEGLPAIYWAYQNRDEASIRSISEKITDLREFLVDAEGRSTPLHEACAYGLTALIHEYIGLGLDIYAKDMWEDTPLDRARCFIIDQSGLLNKDHIECWVRLLVMLGEDTASAQRLVDRYLGSREPQHHIPQPENGKVPVSHKWFETSIAFEPNLDDIPVGLISHIDDCAYPRQFQSNTFIPRLIATAGAETSWLKFCHGLDNMQKTKGVGSASL